MRKILLALAIAGMPALLAAQSPVSWSYSALKTGDKQYEIYITATISQPWHIYSQSSPEDGALPTQFTFNKNPLLVLDGKTKETGTLEQKFEEVFGVTVRYYSNKVVFTQPVRLKANVKTNLAGTVEFMLCNEQQCLPPQTIPFSVALQ